MHTQSNSTHFCVTVCTQISSRKHLSKRRIKSDGATPLSRLLFRPSSCKRSLTSVNTNIDGRVNHARRQPARQEQLGLNVVNCLAQGQINSQLGGAGDRTSNLSVTIQLGIHRNENSWLKPKPENEETKAENRKTERNYHDNY